MGKKNLGKNLKGLLLKFKISLKMPTLIKISFIRTIIMRLIKVIKIWSFNNMISTCNKVWNNNNVTTLNTMNNIFKVKWIIFLKNKIKRI